MTHKKIVGIIGGSGFYNIEGFEIKKQRRLSTPFGKPSDAYTITEFAVGENKTVEVVFLPRHGVGHRYNPSEVNYRANIYGMKTLGAQFVIGVSAVGSLKEELKPGELVLPDQFFDRTKGIRKSTFFEDGAVAHVSFADPFCDNLRGMLASAAAGLDGVVCHNGGTYVCMEGPQFSTRAESHFYRSIGGSLIGMTNLTEAKLAREAELCYASICLVTDYDCWRTRDADVDISEIIKIMNANVANAQRVIKAALPAIAETEPCHADALASAIMTDRSKISLKTKVRLEKIAGKYFS